MGDINFNISKDVDLNKRVTLDIDKDVNVNVNNPDQLATAEADAEAFGPNALAEVDAYTLVTAENGGVEPFPSPGQVDAVGNNTVVLIDNDGNGLVSTGDQIRVSYVDVDDINGFGHLAPLTSPPPQTPDALNPQPEFSQTDKLFNVGAPVPAVPGEFFATLANSYTIDFGVRSLPTLGLNSGPAPLSIEVAAGAQYLVEQVAGANTDIELEFDDPNVSDVVKLNFGAGNHVVTDYTQTAAGIGSNVGEWTFDLVAILEGARSVPGDGTAFAYAESTAALDRNPTVLPS